jgi:hypothetical protein
VLVPTVYVGQASSHGVRPKAPGGDIAGRAELVGRGRKPTSCGAAWDGGSRK